MTFEDRCTREDLEAIVTCWDRWSVDDQGNAETLTQPGSSDPDDTEEYVCNNCGEYFTPDKAYSATALELAWQQALKHQTSGSWLCETIGWVAELSIFHPKEVS